MEENQDLNDIGEELLKEISPDRDELINRRINHINFARTIIWLCIKSRTEDFVYTSGLSHFLGVSVTRSHQILSDLANIGILGKRFPTSNLVEYWIEKEEDKPIILKYFEKAKKTLGVDFKLTIKKEG